MKRTIAVCRHGALLAVATLALNLVGNVAAQVPPPPYDVGWDDAIGLWNHNTNQSLHQIRANAWKLVAAGMDGMLDQVPTLRVLNNLRTAQSTTASRGNFWWDWEDGKVTDSNGGFFTGLGLLTLRMEFASDLTTEQLAVLDTILDELAIFMAGQTASMTEGYLKYPNSALGEVTCDWLLRELHGGVTPYYQGRLTTALSYYRDNNWGWGEHLSDLYVKIVQEELVALLVYGQSMNATNRDLAQSLLAELADIDAAFYGGPRTPTIRCYEMDVSPRTPEAWNGIYKPYLDSMVPWAGQYGSTGYQILSVLGYERGLHTNLTAGPLPPGPVTTDCHGGVKALSVVRPRWRFGAMSSYPLAVDSNTKTSGLHWQSMPAAFWHVAGDWAYLQWVAREGTSTRALPAISRDNVPSCVLSDVDSGARVGNTFGLRKDDSLLILRRLPKLAGGWPWVKDRFRVMENSVEPQADATNGWERLVMVFEQETLTVAYRCLGGAPVMSLLQGATNERLWEAKFNLPDGTRTNLAMVWYMTVGPTSAVPPAFSGSENAASFSFTDGTIAQLDTWAADAPWTLTEAEPPEVENQSAMNFSDTSATARGTVLAGAPNPETYICWGTNFSLTDSTGAWEHVEDLGPRYGAFAANLTGLVANCTYYYRCYTTNNYGDDWATTYTNFTTAAPAPPVSANDWMYQARLSFAGYTQPEVLTNFPVLVKLGPNIAGFSYGQFQSTNAAGEVNADLRFTDATGVEELNYEVETWNPAGVSLVWVQVPRLASGSDAIYARWGRAGVAAPACTTNGATWTEGFVGVWHLKETSGALSDSTANRFSGARRDNTAGTAGMVGGGQSFDGLNDYVEVADKPSFSFGDGSTDSPFSLSAWIRPDPSANAFQIVTKANSTSSYYPPPPEWALNVATNGDVRAYLYDASTGVTDRMSRVALNIAVAQGAWSFVTMTYNGNKDPSGITLYKDGTAWTQVLDAKGTSYGGMNDTASTVDIGSSLRLSNNTANRSYSDGLIDEVRVERVVRSPAWIWACWTNQMENSTFLTYGPLTSRSEGTIIIIR